MGRISVSAFNTHYQYEAVLLLFFRPGTRWTRKTYPTTVIRVVQGSSPLPSLRLLSCQDVGVRHTWNLLYVLLLGPPLPSKCQLPSHPLLTLYIRPLQRLTRAGEYDFQTDITALTTRARDGHFSFTGDATELFVFERTAALVSISSDGLALPQIYAFGE
jgi:hypothetical protein